MIKQTESSIQRNITIWEWLKGFFFIQVSRKSKPIKILPRWLIIVILSLPNLGMFIGQEIYPNIIIDLLGGFLFFTFIWYGFDRLRGKTRV